MRGAAIVVCADVPYPATSGTPLRTWQTISLAARTHDVGVLSVGANDGAVEKLPNVALWRHVDAAPAKSADHGFPLLTDDDANAALEATLADMEAALHPRVVIFSNLWPARTFRAPALEPRRTILDLHNAYSTYAQQTGRDRDRIARLEAGAARQVDALWTCSEEDARALRPHCASADVIVMPNGIDVAAYAGIREASRAARRSGPTLLFVASYWYEPNRVAAEALIARIFPAVRNALPGARLVLAGAAPGDAMLAAAASDRSIVVTGRVADVRPYLELADIVVAPLVAGSGTRLKLLEAFAARRPVVTTTKGAEGLDVENDAELLIRDGDEAFAHAVIELGGDPERRRALAGRAYRRTAERYGWEAVAPLVARALA